MLFSRFFIFTRVIWLRKRVLYLNTLWGLIGKIDSALDFKHTLQCPLSRWYQHISELWIHMHSSVLGQKSGLSTCDRRLASRVCTLFNINRDMGKMEMWTFGFNSVISNHICPHIYTHFDHSSTETCKGLVLYFYCQDTEYKYKVTKIWNWTTTWELNDTIRRAKYWGIFHVFFPRYFSRKDFEPIFVLPEEKVWWI